MNEYFFSSDCKISLPGNKFPLKTPRKHFTTQKYTTINQLLDKCLVELFKRLEIADLLSFRLVNSRFNKIIQRNFNCLAKKEVKLLRLIETPAGKFMRYDLHTFSSNVDRFFGELYINELNKPLRHMKCLSLSLEYAKLSDQVLFELQRCIRNRLQTLELNCSSLVGSFQVFVKCLKQWNLLRLNVINCKFAGEEDWNYLFRLNTQIINCSFSFTSPTRLEITDQTFIDCWSSKLCWPRIILLKNVYCSRITSTALANLIKKTLCSESHTSGDLLWNFGAAFSFSQQEFNKHISSLQCLVENCEYLPSGTLFVKFKFKSSSRKRLHLRIKFLN